MHGKEQNPFLSRMGELGSAWQEAKILYTAVSLGLFDQLNLQKATAQKLADDLRLTLRGTEIILDALVADGYLKKTSGVYQNTPEVDRYFVKGQPDAIAYITGHHNQMFKTWAHLEDIIRNGKKDNEHEKATLTDKEANKNFILGMAEVSRQRLGPILDKLPLKEAKQFVDLGGGPAHYCCEAVKQYPNLSALLVDLPLTVEVAKVYIEKEGCTDRVQTLVCNFYREKEINLEKPAEIMLVSQVLHAEGPQENIDLLKKIYPQMAPGGTLAICENIVNPDRTSPKLGASFAVNMLAGTQRGRTYTEEEIIGWIKEAGFELSSSFELAPRTWMFLAKKP